MNFPNKIADFVVKARWYFFGFFMLLIIGSLILIPMVGTNYDMTKYLPSDSDTKIALEVMTDEFGSSGTASIVITNATPEQVAEVAGLASQIKGVKNAIFSNTKDYYNSETKAGLIQIFFEHGNYEVETEQALADLRELCESKNADASFCGDSVDAVASKNAITNEMWIILLVAVAIMLGILFLTSRSWIEPLIYLIVIGTSIIINMGTNLIMGEISYITKSISTIMLMAIIMDYCIVLCSRYREESEKGGTPTDIMTRALAGSFNAILACSLTVLVGLVALCFMNFKIGLDLGVVLAKGVAISIFAVLFFMPSVILMFQHAMHSWQHKSFLPRLNKLGTFAHKTRWVMPVIMLGLIVSAIFLQSNITFTYVVDNHLDGSQLEKEEQVIEANFGKQNTLVIMVPKGDIASESRLLTELMEMKVGDDGTVTINKASGFANTELATVMNASAIKNKFYLSDDAVNSIFKKFDKNPESDTLYLYQVIETLQADNDLIKNSFAEKQDTFDTRYKVLAGFKISPSKEASEFNIYSQANYKTMYANLKGDSAPATDVQVFAGIYAQILDKEVTAVTDEDVLPAYAVIAGMQTAATSGSIDLSNYPNLSKTVLSPTYSSLVYTQMTKAQVVQQGLTQETVDAIFKVYNIKDEGTILSCQLIQALCNRDAETGKTIMEQYCDAEIATVASAYASDMTAQEMYYSDDYARLLFNINASVDEQIAIDTVNKLREILNKEYVEAGVYEKYYIVNSTQNLIDTMNVFSGDRTQTDLITIIGVFLLVLLLMRSLSIPVLLVFLIQGAIWINLAVGTFFGESIFFVCYLLAMVIQMGATIDYAILMTDRYVFFRKTQGRQQAIKTALNSAFPTVITSGSILIVAAYSIHFISTLPLLKSIGGLIGRGALISVIAVMFVLPSVLLLFDKIICKTTLKADFLDEKKNLIIVEPETVNGAPVNTNTTACETTAESVAGEKKATNTQPKTAKKSHKKSKTSK